MPSKRRERSDSIVKRTEGVPSIDEAKVYTARMSDGPTLPQRKIPLFLYGTAWKEERTEELTRLALAAGFRGIDTANQRKHYVEEAVGKAIAASGLARHELFVQTKFTYARGQDHRLPYDEKAPIAEQVRQSFQSSLAHLGIEDLDAMLLHGPWNDTGWTAQDREAWQAMEKLYEAGRVRLLGVSNVTASQLALLCQQASIAPAFVQNRCYARTGWDQEVRELCRRHGIVYQGFSLLTANKKELGSEVVIAMAKRLGATVPQLVFRFALESGMLPLTGTSTRAHMDEDLKSPDIAMSSDDFAVLARLGK
jgi:diketogulonate reductase-like aldo/keto reductase